MGKRRPSGDGMVRKRDDGRWEGRIVVGHKANGDPIFRHVYAKTQKALTEKLHQSIECHQDVELTEDSRMTLGEWLDRWLAEYKDGTIRPGTLEGYRNYIENYIKPQLGGKQVSLITTQDVQRMYRRLKSGGRVREDAEGSKRLSDSTVRHIHTMLHGAMKAAVQAHIIPKNPTENATAPKLNYKPMQVLNEQELDTFLQAVQKDDIWRDFFYTELMTGLRRGEICALMWRDFDAKAGTLGISRTLHSKGQGIYALGDTKTSQGNRTIILPESVAALLRARKKNSISQWIFPQPTSPELPMNPGTAYRRLKTLLEEAGLPSIRFHDLRHPYVKYTTKIFSLRLMDFQAKAYNSFERLPPPMPISISSIVCSGSFLFLEKSFPGTFTHASKFAAVFFIAWNNADRTRSGYDFLFTWKASLKNVIIFKAKPSIFIELSSVFVKSIILCLSA